MYVRGIWDDFQNWIVLDYNIHEYITSLSETTPTSLPTFVT